MDMVAANTAVVRRRAAECYIWAEVVLPCGAVVAFLAGHTGLDGYAVARLQVRDIEANGDDLSGGFVA
jgi:hypothetical protein